MTDPIDTAAIREWITRLPKVGWTLTPDEAVGFIRRARTDVPALCDALDEARAEVLREVAAEFEAKADTFSIMDTQHAFLRSAARFITARADEEASR